MNASFDRSQAAGKCPDPEALSAHFDNEGLLGEDDAAHVKRCELCGKRLDDYGRISNGMKCALSSAQASDMLFRIKTGVHEKLKREGEAKPPLKFPYWISSVAAGLAVCALGAYMVTHMEKPQGESQAPAPIEERLAASPSALVPSELSVPQPKALASNSKPSESPSFGAIDLKQLSSVSFGGDDGARMIAGAVDGGNSSPAVIDASVRHVWMLPSGANLPGSLKAIAKAASLDPSQISGVSESGDGCKATFSVSRRQAVALVRAFKASGFELLSPQQPQPEQSVFSGNGAEPVSYQADFVFKR